MSTNKTLRDYAKEAKARMKSSFWQDYKSNVKNSAEQAESDGESASKVIKYYQVKATETINGVLQSDEDFYKQVKKLLDTVGDVSDAIGRLTDKEYYKTLSYEQRGRYTLELSNKYLKAKERYYKEKKYEKTV
ncbi:MAG: hypothetical protein IKL82_03985 [Clostridia bacterium]|nr:hypothetical protein [Clostridia bacterium]